MDKVFAIALTTYRESIRGKILYSVLIFAAAIVALASFFGKFTIGDEQRVLKDFGLFSMSFFSVAFCVISGAAFLHKDLARKTIYNMLSKSVARETFLLGKYFGMLWTTSLLVVLMGLLMTGFLTLMEGTVDWSLFQAYLYLIFEIIIVSAAAIFFSALVVTPVLSGLFTFGLFLAGRSSAHILKFSELSGDSITKALYWILPHLDVLNISNGIVYGEVRSLENVLWSLAYCVSYAALLLVLAFLAFRRREFN